jgi:NADP-dependent 3-hydroxy acid dehydrogenase YdfG
VVAAARRAERLDALAQQLPGSLAVATDVTSAPEVDRLLGRTLETFGGIDVLVDYVGQGLHVPLGAWRSMISGPSSSSTSWRRCAWCKTCWR